MFIAIKMEDGRNKGKINFYYKVLDVTRQGFYHYLKTKDLRRICSANGGLPPVIKRQQYYASLQDVA